MALLKWSFRGSTGSSTASARTLQPAKRGGLEKDETLALAAVREGCNRYLTSTRSARS